jgi:hypothetical protein
LAGLAAREVQALIADGEMRQRDERFATQDAHKEKPDPLSDKSKPSRKLPLYRPADFTYDPVARTCVCPAGKSLYRKGQANVTNFQVNESFRGTKRDCVPCAQRAQRAQCLRKPEKTQVRQVAFFRGRDPEAPPTHTVEMKARIDTPQGRALYAVRFGAIEPVFGNICANKSLTRFTLRGRTKVTGQFTLYCLVHNIEKLARHGYAQHDQRGPPHVAPMSA